MIENARIERILDAPDRHFPHHFFSFLFPVSKNRDRPDESRAEAKRLLARQVYRGSSSWERKQLADFSGQAFLEAVTLPVHFQQMAVVSQSVYQGHRHGRVLKNILPLFKR
jgi:hypothetical protein